MSEQPRRDAHHASWANPDGGSCPQHGGGAHVGECPNGVHADPLPDDFRSASNAADDRFVAGWQNVACPDCGQYGWLVPKHDHAATTTRGDVRGLAAGEGRDHA